MSVLLDDQASGSLGCDRDGRGPATAAVLALLGPGPESSASDTVAI